MVRRALLCGINVYKSVRKLQGCLRDLESMRSLLTGTYGFRNEDIRTMTDQDVVKNKVKKEWKWLLSGAGPGDLLVFHFSGHGSFRPDQDGKEGDRNDELLCLYDMDFNKPGTYLLDDEFDAWTREKPEGADLIILTDCCHSGTNTRVVLEEVDGKVMAFAIDQATTLRLAKETREVEGPMEVVARFLPPPDYLPRRKAALRSTVRRSPQRFNHLHIAACQDNETAADAPIGGQYHGAFTYHLCMVLQAEPGLGSHDLTARLVQALTTPPFSQRPRENGGPRPGPIFGGVHAAWHAPAHVGDRPPQTDGDLRNELQELIDSLRDLTATLRHSPAVAARPREAGRRVLVYVHGIDEHPGDYSAGWWNALRPNLDGLFGKGDLDDTRFNVHWSDIVNPRVLPGRPGLERGLGDEAALARRLIDRELEERAARYAEPGRARQARGAIVARGGGPQLDDFLRYMFQPGIRTAVLARFTGIVRPRLAASEVLNIISHSWGTVVAYEGLLQLESEGLSGRVANLFTAGAALSIGVVRWQLGLGGLRPAQVGRWANLDAMGDSVGGSIGAIFPLDQEYLELEPTGCARGWFGYDLSCAHGSYFKAENVQVNRNIFAKHILEG